MISASDDSENPSLLLNRDLIKNIRLKTNRDMSMAALQGRYWCEVWDTRSTVAGPTRRRSSAYDLRFSGLINLFLCSSFLTRVDHLAFTETNNNQNRMS